MNTASRYEEVLEGIPLEERQVVALERIADSLEVIAADRRYERLSDVRVALEQLHERAPSRETSERARLRQAYRAATSAARAEVTGLPCPWEHRAAERRQEQLAS